jgi:hypothetical protein
VPALPPTSEHVFVFFKGGEMLQGPSNSDARADDQRELHRKRARRIGANFLELYAQTPADDRPLAVTDEIIMMLMDDDEAKLRIEGLFKKDEESNSNCGRPEDFQHELELIRQYGVDSAVNDHGLNLELLCAMVDDPVLCRAAHEAFIKAGNGSIAQSPLPRLS